ncbi:MAG: hypothetical protein QOG53_2466 [Frankiales bacterium]|jgi:hypothetical protein|nr:hypothetical protein [Frankiales bacterium]
MKLSRLAVPVATAGILAVGVVAVASADPSPAPSKSSSPSPDASAKQKAPDKKGRAGGLLKHSLHGEFTVGKRDGSETRVMVNQRGEITKVDTTAKTLTMKSPDGFLRTYTVTNDTRIRSKGQDESFADLKAGERAMVVAEKTGSTYTATVIRCVRDAADRPAAKS